jgi:hypothetical protein
VSGSPLNEFDDRSADGELDRRNFMTSCGKFAVTVTPVMTVLMSTSLSTAAIAASTGGGGSGGGDGSSGSDPGDSGHVSDNRDSSKAGMDPSTKLGRDTNVAGGRDKRGDNRDKALSLGHGQASFGG